MYFILNLNIAIDRFCIHSIIYFPTIFCCRGDKEEVCMFIPILHACRGNLHALDCIISIVFSLGRLPIIYVRGYGNFSLFQFLPKRSLLQH